MLVQNLGFNAFPEAQICSAGTFVRLYVRFHSTVQESDHVSRLDQATRMGWSEVQGVHNAGQLARTISGSTRSLVRREVSPVSSLFIDFIGDHEGVLALLCRVDVDSFEDML